jgi:hypothetical protein
MGTAISMGDMELLALWRFHRLGCAVVVRGALASIGVMVGVRHVNLLWKRVYL